MMCLTELERKLAKHFDSIEIRGERSRTVPVLLTPDMIAAMDLIIKNRSVPSPQRMCTCLHTQVSFPIANQSGAKYLEALTSTRQWKKVATLSTALNLKVMWTK